MTLTANYRVFGIRLAIITFKGSSDEQLGYGEPANMPVPNNIESVEQIETVLAEIVDKLVAAFDPERIYLFGSRGRRDAWPDSDYDFMVVVPHSDLTALQRMQKAYRATQGVPELRDIIVLTHDEIWRRYQRQYFARAR